MVKFLCFLILYLVIGSVVTFIVCRWRGYDKDDAIGIGVTWPFTFPFACAVYFAEKLNGRK